MFTEQPGTQHQQNQQGHSGLQEMQEDSAPTYYNSRIMWWSVCTIQILGHLQHLGSDLVGEQAFLGDEGSTWTLYPQETENG